MIPLNVRNVNEALARGKELMLDRGISKESRYGDTLEVPCPVATTYSNPRERVLFLQQRDANPFFHLMESLWILAGRDDVLFLEYFNKRIAEFSDNGKTFHGAYGYRLREPRDQIEEAIGILSKDHTSRRVVLQIWNSFLDLGTTSKDIPCNDLIFLKPRAGRLDMTVCCRSNDMLWGAYGANAVQFSMLQEYIALSAKLIPGNYTQVSDSFHVYVSGPGGELWNKIKNIPQEELLDTDAYAKEIVSPRLLFNPFRKINNKKNFDEDLKYFFKMFDLKDDTFIRAFAHNSRTDFFKHTVLNAYLAYKAYKSRDFTTALEIAKDISSADWQLAMYSWLLRRKIKHERKSA